MRRAGLMDQRISLYRRDRTQNDTGGFDVLPVLVGSRCPASVRVNTGTQGEVADQERAVSTFEVVLNSDTITESLTQDGFMVWHRRDGDVELNILYPVPSGRDTVKKFIVREGVQL